jgi:tetratricopeptide (TPR) repeat protein
MSRPRKKGSTVKAAPPRPPGFLERHLRLWNDEPAEPGEPASSGRARRLRRLAALVVVVLCCLATRLSAARSLDVDNDEASYTTGVGLQYAEYLRSGDLMGILRCRENYEHPPLVKLVNGAAIALTGRDRTPEEVIAVCRTVAVTFACLTAVLLFLLSPWAGLVFSLHSWEVYYSSKGWLDSGTVFFTVAAFFFFLRARGKWNRSMVASALCLGAGVAAKYVNGLFALTLLPFLVFVFRRQPRFLLLYVGISVLTFFALDPAIWLDPVGNLRASVTFHRVESGTALYQRFLERYGGDRGPLGQFISLWGHKARYQADRLAFGLDRVILVLGLVGLPFLFRRSVVLFSWFLVAALFLLLYPIKYPHYSMVFIPALALSAAEALRSGISWLGARASTLVRFRLPPIFRERVGEREVAALTAAAFAIYASIFAVQRWDVRGDVSLADNSFAYTLARLGRTAEASAIFARSGQRGGELGVAAHLNLADLHLRQNQPAQARAELAQVFQVNPASAEGHMLMGTSFLNEDRLDEALEEYRKVDTGRLPDPNARATLWVNVGSVHLRKKQLPESREALERAVGLVPNHGEAHYLLGLACFLQGDPARAEREIRLAIEGGVTGWKVFHDLGIACAQQRRLPEAIAAWEKALAFDPGNALTRKALEDARRMAR